MRQTEFYFVQLELKRNKWFAPPGKHARDHVKLYGVDDMWGSIVTFKEGNPWVNKDDPIHPGDLVYIMHCGKIAKVRNDIEPIGVAVSVHGGLVDVHINPA